MTNVSDRETETSFFYTDSLIFWTESDDEHPELIELTIESEQTIGKQSAIEPTIRAVQVSLQAL